MTTATADWSIQEIARAAGTTSRTLRHYDAIGLLPPSRVGGNGYRYYDPPALLRLQRILLLRGMGFGLADIGGILDEETDAAAALRTHLELLEGERERLERQIAAVRTTLRKTERGDPIMPHETFDGFDNSGYKDEVVERWGEDAWQRGDRWWRALSADDRKRFQQTQIDIARDFARARTAGLPADGEEAQAIARRQYRWISAGWGGRGPDADAFVGLGEMYVADPRFTETYDRHGDGTAVYVRDAMVAYAERELR